MGGGGRGRTPRPHRGNSRPRPTRKTLTMELAGITGPGTAFLAGLVTSLHCAGMCGPLACAVMPAPSERVDAQTVSSVYHVSRLAGYGLLGALAGGVGRLP